MSEYEKQVIKFESARNEAMDRFFAARPHIARSKNNEFFFESGFRMSWELLEREAIAKAGGAV